MTNSTPVTHEQSETLVIARFDDGRRNAVNHDAIDGLTAALERATEARLPLVLLGRENVLSAGFDLKVFQQGPEPTAKLVRSGFELLQAFAAAPIPVVVGATGHAVAMGSMLLLVADYRVGIDGAFTIGFNELAIGLPLPNVPLVLATHRLSKRHLTRATLLAETYDPAGAVDAGYLDEVVDAGELEKVALAKGEALSTLSRGAFAATKTRAREALVTDLATGLQRDIAELAGPTSA